MHSILVLHGPNLQALGSREPEIYGRDTLAGIDDSLHALAGELGVVVETLQSAHEGVLVDAVWAARGRHQGIIMNPGGLTHTSVALRDAVSGAGLPAVEVHVSNPHQRERFRHVSLVAGVCLGTVQGFGADSYHLALRALAAHLRRATPS